MSREEVDIFHVVDNNTYIRMQIEKKKSEIKEVLHIHFFKTPAQ